MDTVTPLTILVALLTGIGIGWFLHADVRPWLAYWLDRRAARGR